MRLCTFLRDFGFLTTLQSHTRNLTAWLSWVSASSLMWNVVGPFEVGSPADSEAVLEVVQNQNRPCLYLAEEGSEPQIAAIGGDSVVAGEEHSVDEVVEVSVEVEADSVADEMTTGVVVVAAGMAVADSGVYFVSYHHDYN